MHAGVQQAPAVVQTCVSPQDPHEPPQASSPQTLPAHNGSQHFPESVQAAVEDAQCPQVKPHSSTPHSRSPQLFWQTHCPETQAKGAPLQLPTQIPPQPSSEQGFA